MEYVKALLYQPCNVCRLGWVWKVFSKPVNTWRTDGLTQVWRRAAGYALPPLNLSVAVTREAQQLPARISYCQEHKLLLSVKQALGPQPAI